jgi:hypothetical protein
MRKHELYSTDRDAYEYYGNNEILRIRKQYGTVVRKDWIVFDSPEKAMEYFNTKCGSYVGFYNYNKIVQRFYETRFCRSVWRKAKIPIPPASYGVFRNFYHSPPGCGTALSL